MDDLIIFIIYNSVFGTFIRRICRICKFFQILGVINVSCDVFCNSPDRFHQRSDQFHRQPGRAGYSKATLAYWLILCSFEYVMHSRKRMRYAFIFLNHFSEFGNGPALGLLVAELLCQLMCALPCFTLYIGMDTGLFLVVPSAICRFHSKDF